jgi:hypothetical protein
VYRRLERDPGTSAALKKIESLRLDPVSSVPISCTSGVAGGASGPSPIDGTWTMTVARQNLVGNPAYGRTPTDDDLRLDAGAYRFTVRRGQFEFWLRGPVTRSHDVGTAKIKDAAIVLHIARGHDIGETWSYRWSLYRGRLTFRLPVVRATAGPPNMMFEQWRRVTPSPAQRATSPVVGTWEVRYTRAEYAAAGADRGELQEPRNWGTFTLTLERDGTSILRKRDAPLYVSQGRYVVTGDTIVLIPPPSARDAGARWLYTWRIYRGRLSLARGIPNRADGTVQEPTGLIVKPFVPANR